MEKFDNRISVAKGICIILMVVGHAGCPPMLKNFIYLFHMPLFFFVSGFLLKDKYLDQPKSFIKQKIKTLYIPFIKWSLIFLALHNVFYTIHFYSTAYTMSNYKESLIKIFTLRGTEQLLGGFWFLKELLFASLICMAILLIIKRFNLTEKDKIKKYGSIIISALLFVYLLVVEILNINVGSASRTFLATILFFGGYLFSKYESAKRNHASIAVICLSLCFLASLFFDADMTVKGFRLMAYYIISIIGCIGVLNLSGAIRGQVKNFFVYVGTRTLYILTFHFTAFKLVSAIKISFYKLDIEQLSDFPVIEEHNSIYWLLYTAIGVAIPIVLKEAVNYSSNKYRVLILAKR